MSNVMVIPARRQVGNNIKKAEKPKLRVAAYCRVSTDSDEQATSYLPMMAVWEPFQVNWLTGILLGSWYDGADRSRRWS